MQLRVSSPMRVLPSLLTLVLSVLLLGQCEAQTTQNIQPSAVSEPSEPSAVFGSSVSDMFDLLPMDTSTVMETGSIETTVMEISSGITPSSSVTTPPTPSPQSSLVETPSSTPSVTSTPPPVAITTTSMPVTAAETPTTSTPDEVPTTEEDTTTSTTTTTKPTVQSTQAPAPLSLGAIIGIAAGGGAVLLLLLFLMLCCCCCCFCCKTPSSQEYSTGNEGFRPHIVVRTYNQNVERAGSLISRGSRGSFARSSMSSIASSIRSLRRLSGKKRGKNKPESHFMDEESVPMKVTPL